MSGEVRFEELPERTIFWLDGGLYEKTGEETAVSHGTGQTLRFYGSDPVYPIGAADVGGDDGTKTDMGRAARTSSVCL